MHLTMGMSMGVGINAHSDVFSTMMKGVGMLTCISRMGMSMGVGINAHSGVFSTMMKGVGMLTCTCVSRWG